MERLAAHTAYVRMCHKHNTYICYITSKVGHSKQTLCMHDMTITDIPTYRYTHTDAFLWGSQLVP